MNSKFQNEFVDVPENFFANTTEVDAKAAIPTEAMPDFSKEIKLEDTPEYKAMRERDTRPEGVISAGWQGTKRALNSIGASIDTVQGDKEELLQGKKDADTIKTTQAQEDFSRVYDEKTSSYNGGVIGEIGNSIKAAATTAWDNPQGAADEFVAQAPNSAVILGTAAAGAKLGALAGAPAGPVGIGVGAIVGGVIGMFTGNAMIETGSIAQDKIKDGTISDADMDEALKQGLIKSGVITTVDTATLGLNKLLLGQPSKLVEGAVKKSLIDNGINLASKESVETALKNKAIVEAAANAGADAFEKATGIKKRTARGVAAFGLESMGEGFGEYAGSSAAGLDASISGAVLESIMATPMSVTELYVAKKLDRAGEFTKKIADPESALGDDTTTRKNADDANTVFDISDNDELNAEDDSEQPYQEGGEGNIDLGDQQPQSQAIPTEEQATQDVNDPSIAEIAQPVENNEVIPADENNAQEAINPIDPASSETDASATNGNDGAIPEQPEAQYQPENSDNDTQPNATALTGVKDKAYTPDNKEIEVQYEVMDAADLVASNDENGNINPDFPMSLQPRDRTGKKSQAQISKLSSSINPDRLGASNSVTDGAPIIGENNVVESGNGRVLALRKAYKGESASHYKQWLMDNAETLGLNKDDINGIANPVLVRRRTTPMTEQERVRFAIDANKSTVSGMSALELAKTDAESIDAAMLAGYMPSADGNVLAASNSRFLRDFSQAIGGSDTAGLMAGNGDWTRQMADRVQAAVFHKAYGNDALTNLLAQEADPIIKNVINALNVAAPYFARIKDEAIANGFDVAQNISDATAILIQAKSSGISVDDLVNQADMFGDLDPTASLLAKFMDSMSRNSKTIADLFTGVAEGVKREIDQRSSGDMFDRKPLSINDILANAAKSLEARNEKQQAAADLFSQAGNQTNDTSGASASTEPRNDAGSTGSEQQESGSRTDGMDTNGSTEGAKQKIAEPNWWKKLTGAERYNKLSGAGIKATAKTKWSSLTAEQQYNLNEQWGDNADRLAMLVESVRKGNSLEKNSRADVGLQLVEHAINELRKEESSAGIKTLLEKASERLAPNFGPVADLIDEINDSIPEAAQVKPDKQEVKKKANKPIGKNSKGVDLFEDENGVRSYVDRGVSVSEPVVITPSRNGVSASRTERRDEYKTVEELEQDNGGDKPLGLKPSSDDIGNAYAAIAGESAGRSVTIPSLIVNQARVVSANIRDAMLEGRDYGNAIAVEYTRDSIGAKAYEGVLRQIIDGRSNKESSTNQGNKSNTKQKDSDNKAKNSSKKSTSNQENKSNPDYDKAKADLDDALGDLGEIFLNANLFSKKAVPTELDSARLIPVLTRVMDAAFRMGYSKFKENARFVLDTIRDKFGDAAADSLVIDELQGAYIGMKKGADSKLDVISVESIAELYEGIEQQDTVENEPDSLVNAIKESLDSITDNRALKSVVASFYGIKQSDVTAEQMKDAQEAVELALVERAREIVSDNNGNVDATYNALLELYQNQPNLNMRSSTSMENQAYSTPAPLAYLASQMAGINQSSTVYEPTAGNGMLLIGAGIDNATVNELNDLRASQLRDQGFDVTQNDATTYTPSNSVDAIITNPPFGTIKPTDYDGYQFRAIDHLITAKALEAMADNGKAAIIIGANKVAGEIGAGDRVFFNYLYSNYNVVEHFEIDGDLYKRQGAGWPVRLIIVNGRKKSDTISPKSGEIERVDTWEQVHDKYNEFMDSERSQQGSTESANAENIDGLEGSKKLEDQDNASKQSKGATGKSGTGRSGNRVGSTGSNRDAGSDTSGNKQESTSRDDSGSGNAGLRPKSSKLQDEASNGSNDVQAAREPNPRELDRGSKQRSGGSVSEAKGSDYQVAYKTFSSGSNEAVLTPANMARSTEIALANMDKAVGGIDNYVMKNLGYDNAEDLHDAFMGLQVDTIAAAIYNASEKNKGIIIADQTGVGKGRQAAGIIRYAINQGKIPVFITVKPNLFSDMYGDLQDIGASDVVPFIVNRTENISHGGSKLFKNGSSAKHNAILRGIIETGELPDDANALFITYSQLNTKNIQRDVIDAIKDKAFFVMDESHNAAGDRVRIKKGGVKQETTAGFIYRVIENAPVTYLSATYAKRPDNIPVYYRTDLMDAVDTIDELVDAVAAGGAPLQTVMSGMLAEAGQLFRRERSFDGIEVLTNIDTENTQEHTVFSDKVTTGLRSIVAADKAFHTITVDAISQAYESQGQSSRGAGNRASSSVDHTNFTSIIHNFISQLLLGLKAQRAADLAIDLHKQGIKPVIALENTMGSFLKQFVEDNGLEIGDAVDADYRDILHKALDRTRRISVTDQKGVKEAIDVPLKDLDPYTRSLYKEAAKIIDSLDIEALPVSPIDYVRAKLKEAGISVSEITGRDYMVDYSGDTPTLDMRSAKEKKDKVATINAFNSGNLDALILNAAGSTGLSIHASVRFEDQKPRHMIVMQAMADINILMQMLGRINRTGQVELPTYSMMGLNIPAEKRPLARTASKMKSLNANTSANTESDTSIKAPDLMNKYGDKVVNDFLKENIEIAQKLNIKEVTDSGSPASGLALKFTGRMALLPVKEQVEIYEQIEAAYSDLIEYLNKTNQNDLEPRTLDLDAKILSTDILYEGKDPDSIFGGNTFIHKVDAKYQGKPPSPEEVAAALDKTEYPLELSAGIMAKKMADKSFIEALTKSLNDAIAELNKVVSDRDTASGSAEEKEANAKKLEKAVEDATAKVENIQDRIKEMDRLEVINKRMLDTFTVGNRVRLNLDDETVTAVIVGLKDSHKKGKGNPFALSKVRVSFMVNNGIRSIDLPFSQLTSGGSIFVEPLVSKGKEGLDRVFDMSDLLGDRRETRYIATGNLIAGSAALKSGRINSFTDSEGNTHLGILLPKSFNEEAGSKIKLATGNKFVMRDDKVITKFLRSVSPSSFGVIVTPDNKISIYRSKDGSDWIIELPKSNAEKSVKSVKFDQALRDAMGADFYGSGKSMTARFSDRKLPNVVSILSKLVKLQANNNLRGEWEKAGGNAAPEVKQTFGRPDTTMPEESQVETPETNQQDNTEIETDSNSIGESEGISSDDAMMRLSEDSATVLGDGTEKGIASDDADKIVNEFLSKLGNNVPLDILIADKQEDIYGERATKENVGTIKGAYHAKKRAFVFIRSNMRSVSDGIQTLRHEILGHYGLNTFKPEDKRAILEKIIAEKDGALKDVWKRVISAYSDKTEMEQAEEVFAFTIENESSIPKQIIDALLSLIHKGLRSLGIAKGVVTKSELRNLARVIAKQIRQGDRVQQTFPESDQDQFRRNDQTKSEAFKKWFGDSKVVDENGEPMVVYHGTGSSFSSFDPETIGNNFYESEGGGFFFAQKRRSASNYAELNSGDSKNVMPVYLQLQNPLTVSVDSDYVSPADYYDINSATIANNARKAGHDSIIINGTNNDNLYVAFNPNQIKSAVGNNGNFDPTDPDIRFRRGEGEANQDNESALAKAIKDGAPIDKLFKAAFGFTTKLTKPAYGRMSAAINTWDTQGKMPWLDNIMKRARAGLIDRYGLDDQYKKRDMARELESSQIMQKGVDLLKSLAEQNLSIDEAKILQDVLTGETVSSERWDRVAEPIRLAIDDLGREAVILGLLDEEVYQKNRGAYLHRTYLKYEANQSSAIGFFSRGVNSFRKNINGKSLKGRGMELKVDADKLRQFDNDWWGQTRDKSKFDEQLQGRKYIVLTKITGRDTDTATADGIEQGTRKGRKRNTVYWPADKPIQGDYLNWDNRGTFEVVGRRNGKIVVWRDYTKAERTSMGEILDARYNIAKTFHIMAHDLSNGRFLKDIAENDAWTWQGEGEPEGALGTAKDYGYSDFGQYDWVKVPETVIAKTNKKKWGELSGKYVRAEIWRDLVQQDQMLTDKVWRKVMTQWKLNKTARNPVVHMNNVMSNLVFMDMADVRARDLVAAISAIRSKSQDYLDAQNSGAFGGNYVGNEIQTDVLQPILDELTKQAAGDKGTFEAMLGTSGILVDGLIKIAGKTDKAMLDAYQFEDVIFRMATYLRRKNLGDSNEDAAIYARDQFLNYDIRAPWVNAARNTVLPFISYTYRAVPVIARAMAERPWKISKYLTIATAVNAMGYMLSGGDEDDERKVLPEDESGNTWLGIPFTDIGVPRMIRMPHSDSQGNPIFLDIRRWIPAGDVFDMNQGQLALPVIPAPLQFSGPIMLAFEFYLNKQAFTGDEITSEHDLLSEKISKTGGWMWRSWMPSAPWVYDSWYWQKIGKAYRGATDFYGRQYDLDDAILSSIGIKLKPVDIQGAKAVKYFELQQRSREIKAQRRNAEKLHRRGVMTDGEYNSQISYTETKMKKLKEDARDLR